MSDAPDDVDEGVPNATADGSIEGKVTAPNGDPVPDARVEFELSGSGSGTFVSTNDSGNYSINGLRPDDYDLRVEKRGFDPVERSNVTVESGLTTRADFSLSRAFRKVIGETSAPWGAGMFARNTSKSGNNFAVQALNDSDDLHRDSSRPSAVRADARGNSTAIEATAEDADAVVVEARNADAIVAQALGPNDDAIRGTSQATSGYSVGVVGFTRSVESTGVEGFALANSGTGKGVSGGTASPNGYGVVSDGQLAVRRDVAYSGDFRRHAATVENTSGDPTGDVLGLKTRVTDPGASMNFVSFVDPNGQVGQIEGDGNGGITIKGTGADFAEYFPQSDPDREFGAGEVVGLDGGEVVATTEAVDAVMVVSTAPILAGNKPRDDDYDGWVPLSLVGQVAASVTGPVRRGDLLVPSPDDDGSAITRRTVDAPERPVVGLALEDHDGGGGEVRTLVDGPGLGRPRTPERSVAPGGNAPDRIAAIERENERLRERNRGLEERLAALETRVGIDDASVVSADD